MFRVLQLNIEVDVVTTSTFYLEGNSCENLIVMYLSIEIGFFDWMVEYVTRRQSKYTNFLG